MPSANLLEYGALGLALAILLALLAQSKMLLGFVEKQQQRYATERMTLVAGLEARDRRLEELQRQSAEALKSLALILQHQATVLESKPCLVNTRLPDQIPG